MLEGDNNLQDHPSVNNESTLFLENFSLIPNA